jgi:hypothetical protein
MKRNKVHILLVAALLVVLGLSMHGCDSFVLYELLDPAGQLIVVPEAAIVDISTTMTFKAQGGEPGYEFSLRTPAEGSITPDGIYEAPPSVSGTVRDIVELTDARKSTAIGIAEVIDTTHDTGPLTITPTTVTVNVNGSYDFSASGGAPPYSFTLFSPVSGTSDDSVSGSIYEAPTVETGTAIVRLTDNDLVSTSATVTVVDSSIPLGINPNPATVAEGGTVEFEAFGGLGGYTYSISVGPGAINGTTGVYTAPANQVGNDLATVEVDDGATTAPSLVTVVPAAPTNLVADNGGLASHPQKIRLTWTDNTTEETGYIIQRKGGGTVDFQVVATVPGGSGSIEYIDDGLSPTDLYGYRVRAYTTGSPNLNSAYSNEAFALPN